MPKKPEDKLHEVADLLESTVGGKISRSSVERLIGSLRHSLRVSRKGVTLSGRGLSEVLWLVAPKIPVRDVQTLQEQNGGMTGTALAAQLIRVASRNSAGVGGVTGALASAGELAPPMWILLPVEVVAETLLIATIEMKLVAELHAVYGIPIGGTSDQRGAAILESWASRRGVTVEDIAKKGGIQAAANKGARAHLVSMVRRKLIARTARNVSSLAPLFIGAVAGAELNRRATRDLGDTLVADLSLMRK